MFSTSLSLTEILLGLAPKIFPMAVEEHTKACSTTSEQSKAKICIEKNSKNNYKFLNVSFFFSLLVTEVSSQRHL